MIKSVTSFQYKAFCAFRSEFKKSVFQYLRHSDELRALFSNQNYAIQTPVVYNKALDDFDSTCAIRLILVGDNPGVTEQRQDVQRYLAGAAGKLARSFFSNHKELGMDFDRQVCVLNKTPFHTHSTSDLKKILTQGSVELQRDFLLSITQSALSTFALQKALGCPIWIVGYSQLKKGGVFEPYIKAIAEEYFGQKKLANPSGALHLEKSFKSASEPFEKKEACEGALSKDLHPEEALHFFSKALSCCEKKESRVSIKDGESKKKCALCFEEPFCKKSVPIFLFQHFSMNCFSVDFRRFLQKEGNSILGTLGALEKLGHERLLEVVKKYCG